MKAKLIEYAYPTSSRATIAGYGKTGCYFVALYPDITSTIGGEAIGYFGTKQEAIKYAESLPNPYNFMHKYFNL